MTTLEIIGVSLIGFAGLCSLCLLMLALGASIVRRDKEEMEDRIALSHAGEKDWNWPPHELHRIEPGTMTRIMESAAYAGGYKRGHDER